MASHSSDALVDELMLNDAALTRRVFRPSQDHRALSRAAVEGVEDPAEAWEVLASRGVIPATWVDSSERVFALDETPMGLEPGSRSGTATHDGVLAYLSRGPTVQDVPPTVDAVVALGADVKGVTTAEQVAREAVRRLAPFGVPQPNLVCWRVVDVASWATQPGDYRHMPVAIVLNQAFERGEVHDRSLKRAKLHPFGTPAWRAAFTWECAGQWRAAARTNSVILSARAPCIEQIRDSGYPPIAETLYGEKFSSLANPFEPLLSLWASGYALDAITPTMIVLAAPRVPLAADQFEELVKDRKKSTKSKT
ncbi:MAG: hypothetical protein Q8Q09_21000 [Deltaproteobacteria bacterium]|nr:hypothetical protein [Deltaproteobacteria bacterium]